MVRAIGKESKIVGTGLMIVKLACDSDDVKPVNGVATGSTCLEVDTGDLYIFSEDDKTWNFLKNVGGDGSGGGGDSDYSTATITVNNPLSLNVSIIMPVINPRFEAVTCIPVNGMAEEEPSETVEVVLYKNKCMIDWSKDGYRLETTGNIEYEHGNGVIISGDGTITFVLDGQ